MTPLPLPSQSLARLQSRAEGGHDDARVLLHLIARADKRDQDVAAFVDSYSSTIAALCRRLEALERGANLRQQDEDAEAAESDSVADAAQRITDYAAKAGMTVDDWAATFNGFAVPHQASPEAKDPPAAPVDDSPVANALRQAEAALADVAEGEIGRLCSATKKVTWAELRCTETLAVIRPAMRQHGIRTSEFPPAAPAPAPAAPAPRPTALVEVVGNELPLLPGGKVDQVLTLAVIRKLAAWLDKQGDHASGNCLRSHLNR